MNTAFNELLPWAREQRWFPTDWKDATWPLVREVPLGDDTGILLAQADPGMPFLQVPIRRENGRVIEASGDYQFWVDWLHAAGIRETLETVEPLGKEQSNTSVVLTVGGSGRWVAKLFRVVHPGANPDVELPLALRSAGYENTPAVRAWYTAELPEGSFTLGVATDMVPNTGTAWDFFREAGAAGTNVDSEARALGIRIGELTSTLRTLPTEDQPTVENLIARTEAALDKAADTAAFAGDFTARVRQLIHTLGSQSAGTQISRVHGDLHLGQVLHTPAGDWQVIDFEGEPLRTLAERVVPDFGLRDLAGMLRSFSYAGWDNPQWEQRTREAFLGGFAQADPLTDMALLRLLEVEKALYEVQYEAQFRPDWLNIPLATIESLLD